MLKDDNERWKALMLVGAILAEDQESTALALAPMPEEAREAIVEALGMAAHIIDPGCVSHDGTTDPACGTQDHPDTRFFDWLMRERERAGADAIGQLARNVADDSCCPDWSSSIETWREHLESDHNQDEASLFMVALHAAHEHWRKEAGVPAAFTLLKWTDEAPKVPGYYWVHDPKRSVHHTWMVYFKDAGHVRIYGGAYLTLELVEGCLWAGPNICPPLPKPKEEGAE